jgi:uncharacterized membrane protein/protein-disulfide isomerase
VRTQMPLNLSRLFALVALTASAVSLENGLRAGEGYCPFHTDCTAVTASPFGNIWGMPLALVGVVAFGILFAMLLFPDGWAGRFLGPLALAGGVLGAGLIVLQAFVIGHWCSLCLVVDVSAIAIALLQLVQLGSAKSSALQREEVTSSESGGDTSARPRLVRAVWIVAAVCAVGLSLFAVTVMSDLEGPVRVPPQISEHWVPGRVNIVEVADFECPHCRRLHEVVMQLLREQGDRVHFVRLTAPMPAHREARYASRAFVCAGEQGKADQMADALFAAESLSPQACEQLAKQLGLAMVPFRACVEDPATDQRLDASVAMVREISPRGLPILWIQDRLLYGEQSIEKLRKAVAAAQEQLTAGKESK